jgi:hypothetical protein
VPKAATYTAERAAFQGAGTTSVTVTVATNCNPGAFLVMIFGNRNTSAGTASVADSRGNTWTVNVGPLQEPGNACGFIASTRQDVATLQAADTLTITLTGAPTLPMALVEEFNLSGSAPFDQSANAVGTSTQNAGTGTSPGLSNPTQLVIAGIAWDDVATPTTRSTGWNAFTTQDRTNGGKTLSAMWKVVEQPDPVSGSMSTGGIAQGTIGMLATYKLPDLGSPPPRFVYMRRNM